MVKITKGLSGGWGMCSHTTQLCSSTWIISHYGNSIAAGSRSGDITILSVITGSQSAVLSGHTNRVGCVAFSQDGTSLVSGSYDKTVKLWDVQTGGIVKTFSGHPFTVWSVSISADSSTIASGSDDGTICLWNIQTGECYHKIQQQKLVLHVMFSPKDPQHLISISDLKVWQWDANGYQIKPPFSGSHVAFSSDGSQFVSCFKKTITIQNSSSGEILTEFQAAENTNRCSFSPNNRFVVITAGKIIYCWDITTTKPQLVETFIGHTQLITSPTFSSPNTLVSASFDGSVKFWQIGAQSTDPATTNLKPASLPLAPIVFATLQSTEGIAITYDSDGIIRVWDILTGTCQTSYQTSAEHHQKRDIQLVNGRLIFVWYINKKIHVWDAENRELLWKVDKPWYGIQDLRISGDGLRVLGLYAPSIWTWSLQTGEVVGKMEIEYDLFSASLIVDGSKVWAYWPESNYEGWDFSIDSTPIELPNISTPTGPSKLWNLKQARITNPATGEVFFQLSGRFENPFCAQCDDSYLVAGYWSGEILILDLTNVK